MTAAGSFASRAPKSVRTGLRLMQVGSIIFFILAILEFVLFGVYLISDDPTFAVDWSNWLAILRLFWLPFYGVLITIAGIAGLSYARGKGPLLSFASLAGMILTVVVIVDLILAIHNLIVYKGEPGKAWVAFLLDMIDIQLFGSLYVIGWLLTKDYLE